MLVIYSIQATIDYGLDSNFTNNVTQRNIDVKTTSSPAVFTFDVENSLTVPATVELETLSDNPKWTCSLDQTSFSLDPFTDCPRTVTATLNPVIELVESVSAPHPSIPPAANGRTLLGGVSLRATDPVLGTATCHIFAFAVTPQPLCFGVPATIVGTPGNDALKGTPGDDVIVGLGGRDVIEGRGGNDLICGGDGDDAISGGPGHDKIDGGDGNDTIDGDAGNDRIHGDAGNDRIHGGPGNDGLDGGLGFDGLNGGPGTDTCVNGEATAGCP